MFLAPIIVPSYYHISFFLLLLLPGLLCCSLALVLLSSCSSSFFFFGVVYLVVVKFTVVFYSGYNLNRGESLNFCCLQWSIVRADAILLFFRNLSYLHCIEILKAPVMDAANVQGRSADSTAPDNSKRMEGNVPTRTVLKSEINLLNTDTDMHRVHSISSIIVYNNANASCDFCRPKVIFGGNRHFSTHKGNTVEHSSECFIHSFDTVTGETLYSSCGFPHEYKQNKIKAEKHIAFCYSPAIQKVVSVCSGIISILPCSDFPSKYYFPQTGFAQRNLRATQKQIVLDTQVFLSQKHVYTLVSILNKTAKSRNLRRLLGKALYKDMIASNLDCILSDQVGSLQSEGGLTFGCSNKENYIPIWLPGNFMERFTATMLSIYGCAISNDLLLQMDDIEMSLLCNLSEQLHWNACSNVNESVKFAQSLNIHKLDRKGPSAWMNVEWNRIRSFDCAKLSAGAEELADIFARSYRRLASCGFFLYEVPNNRRRSSRFLRTF